MRNANINKFFHRPCFSDTSLFFCLTISVKLETYLCLDLIINHMQSQPNFIQHMNKKIVLSNEEYQWALQYLANVRNGILVDPLPTDPDDPAKTVMDKALSLEQELNAIDERMETEGCDVILWFIRKYQKQEGLHPSV